MAGDFKPSAYDWDEGFIGPLRVVGGEGGGLWPDPSDPRAESLATTQDVGSCLGWPGGVVVPSAVGDEAVAVAVGHVHAQPVASEWARFTEKLRYC